MFIAPEGEIIKSPSLSIGCSAGLDVLVLDPQPVSRAGLRTILGGLIAKGRFREAESAAAARQALNEARPHLVVMEIHLNGPNGLEFIKELSSRDGSLPVIVFSSAPEERFAERVLRAGGRGYVMKSSPPSLLIEAARRVLAGGVFVSQAVSEGILLRLSPGGTPRSEPTSLLSDRELEVFLLIGDAVGTAEIARRMRVSVSTVETYRAAIKRKLGLANGAQLVRAAVTCAVSVDGSDLPEPKVHEGTSREPRESIHAGADIRRPRGPLSSAR